MLILLLDLAILLKMLLLSNTLEEKAIKLKSMKFTKFFLLITENAKYYLY